LFNKFNLKEIVFIAIFSVAMIIITGIIMPVVMFTQIFALRQMFSAPFFGLFCTIALMKIPKPGTLTLIGIFTGSILLFMSPVMFFNNVIGAVLAESIALIIFREYNKKKAVITAATLYVPLTLPVTLISTMIMRGQNIADQLGDPFISLSLIAGCIVLSFLGSILGIKLGKELEKAGKL